MATPSQNTPALTIERSAAVLLGVLPSLPTRDSLTQELLDVEAARQRGCFLPDESERVHFAFSRYLHVRTALHQLVEELEQHVRAADDCNEEETLSLFVIGFTAASRLIRSADFIQTLVGRDRLLTDKLNEPDPALGIPPGQFDAISRSLTRPSHIQRFNDALSFAEQNREVISGLRGEAIRNILTLLENELNEPF
ncbi:MAG: hypothetical protein AAF514_08470, partial [Verrucomicrobiota bacterium]